MLFAIFHYVDSSTDGVKAIMGKAASALARIKAGSPNSISHFCSLHCYPLTMKRKMSVALKNILKKQ